MSNAADPGEIQHAAQLIRSGRLVAFPTETVYGLGVNALDAEAVAGIYAVKRRPATSPLIVHVSSIEMAKSLVADWPEAANRLAKKFWPGPLTLVLPLDAWENASREPTRTIPPIVTAGLPTVGLRMPKHPIAQALIEAAGVPLAAPSANRFTELSPTTAEHVRKSLGNEVDYVLDGGACTVGIESTVLSLCGPEPVLLRPGGISRKDLEALIGPITSAQEIEAGAHPAPGMHPRHYSPRTPLLLVSDGTLPEKGKGVYLQYVHEAKRPNVGSKIGANFESKIMIVHMPTSATDYAAALYQELHEADAASADWIAVDQPPYGPDWEAVRDRLRRAAAKTETFSADREATP